MKVSKAMKSSGLRYFSSLTPAQKDKVVFNLLVIKHSLTQLPKPFAKQLLFEINDDKVFQGLQKAKMFKHNGNFYPLNFKELIHKKTNQ